MDYARRPKAYKAGANVRPWRWVTVFMKNVKKFFSTKFLTTVVSHWRYLFILLLVLLMLFLTGRYWWREMRWRYIVIHHTAADFGSLDFFRRIHQKRWGDLAYHIVINNGSDNTAAGQIEYSQRWIKRQSHYSTEKSYLNHFGIAIVLVGDFEKHPIPLIQKQILIRVLLNLAEKYNIPAKRIIGHREVQNTKCPGRHISMVEIRALVAKGLKSNPKN